MFGIKLFGCSTKNQNQVQKQQPVQKTVAKEPEYGSAEYLVNYIRRLRRPDGGYYDSREVSESMEALKEKNPYLYEALKTELETPLHR